MSEIVEPESEFVDVGSGRVPSVVSDEHQIAMRVDRARVEDLQLTGEGGCCNG